MAVRPMLVSGVDGESYFLRTGTFPSSFNLVFEPLLHLALVSASTSAKTAWSFSSSVSGDESLFDACLSLTIRVDPRPLVQASPPSL